MLNNTLSYYVIFFWYSMFSGSQFEGDPSYSVISKVNWPGAWLSPLPKVWKEVGLRKGLNLLSAFTSYPNSRTVFPMTYKTHPLESSIIYSLSIHTFFLKKITCLTSTSSQLPIQMFPSIKTTLVPGGWKLGFIFVQLCTKRMPLLEVGIIAIPAENTYKKEMRPRMEHD